MAMELRGASGEGFATITRDGRVLDSWFLQLRLIAEADKVATAPLTKQEIVRSLAWISTEPNSPNLTPARLHILWAFSPCSVMLNGALIAFLRGVTWPHVFTFRGISAFLLAK